MTNTRQNPRGLDSILTQAALGLFVTLAVEGCSDSGTSNTIGTTSTHQDTGPEGTSLGGARSSSVSVTKPRPGNAGGAFSTNAATTGKAGPPTPSGAGGTLGTASKTLPVIVGGNASTSTPPTTQPPVTPPNQASSEDDGKDCVIGTLPEAKALSPIAKLPDPFLRIDGNRIAEKAEWRCRRREIKAQAEKYAFGEKPAKPESVTGSVTNKSISVKISNGTKSASFDVSVELPTTGAAPYPAVIVYGGFGGDTKTIISEGVAVLSYDPYKVGSEAGSRTNKSGAFYSIYGSKSTTGLLAAWAWGVSRIIDVIEQSDGKVIKADGIGVTGCSRFGKGTFIAGVFDQRVALTMPIESGTGGVPIWRGVPGERAQSLGLAYSETYWFGDAFSDFTNAPTSIPIDTHELAAAIAPRGLFIMDNPHIANLGPKSAHVAALAAAEVYKALGATENISYHSDVASGGHCDVRPEWTAPLKANLQKFLKKTTATTGTIKASSKATGKLTEWADWTSPSLK